MRVFFPFRSLSLRCISGWGRVWWRELTRHGTCCLSPIKLRFNLPSSPECSINVPGGLLVSHQPPRPPCLCSAFGLRPPPSSTTSTSLTFNNMSKTSPEPECSSWVQSIDSLTLTIFCWMWKKKILTFAFNFPAHAVWLLQMPDEAFCLFIFWE